MSLRAAIVAALEALGDGDQALAVVVLLGALEDGGPIVRRYGCKCGATFQWPGERDRHRIVRGHELEQVAA